MKKFFSQLSRCRSVVFAMLIAVAVMIAVGTVNTAPVVNADASWFAALGKVSPADSNVVNYGTTNNVTTAANEYYASFTVEDANDPYVYIGNASDQLLVNSGLNNIDASSSKYCMIRYLTHDKAVGVQILGRTQDWVASPTVFLKATGSWQDAIIDMSKVTGWDGTVDMLRLDFDPCEPGDNVFVSFIAFFASESDAVAYSKTSISLGNGYNALASASENLGTISGSVLVQGGSNSTGDYSGATSMRRFYRSNLSSYLTIDANATNMEFNYFGVAAKTAVTLSDGTTGIKVARLAIYNSTDVDDSQGGADNNEEGPIQWTYLPNGGDGLVNFQNPGENSYSSYWDQDVSTSGYSNTGSGYEEIVADGCDRYTYRGGLDHNVLPAGTYKANIEYTALYDKYVVVTTANFKTTSTSFDGNNLRTFPASVNNCYIKNETLLCDNDGSLVVSIPEGTEIYLGYDSSDTSVYSYDKTIADTASSYSDSNVVKENAYGGWHNFGSGSTINGGRHLWRMAACVIDGVFYEGWIDTYFTTYWDWSDTDGSDGWALDDGATLHDTASADPSVLGLIPQKHVNVDWSKMFGEWEPTLKEVQATTESFAVRWSWTFDSERNVLWYIDDGDPARSLGSQNEYNSAGFWTVTSGSSTAANDYGSVSDALFGFCHTFTYTQGYITNDTTANPNSPINYGLVKVNYIDPLERENANSDYLAVVYRSEDTYYSNYLGYDADKTTNRMAVSILDGATGEAMGYMYTDIICDGTWRVAVFDLVNGEYQGSPTNITNYGWAWTDTDEQSNNDGIRKHEMTAIEIFPFGYGAVSPGKSMDIGAVALLGSISEANAYGEKYIANKLSAKTGSVKTIATENGSISISTDSSGTKLSDELLIDVGAGKTYTVSVTPDAGYYCSKLCWRPTGYLLDGTYSGADSSFNAFSVKDTSAETDNKTNELYAAAGVANGAHYYSTFAAADNAVNVVEYVDMLNIESFFNTYSTKTASTFTATLSTPAYGAFNSTTNTTLNGGVYAERDSLSDVKFEDFRSDVDETYDVYILNSGGRDIYVWAEFKKIELTLSVDYTNQIDRENVGTPDGFMVTVGSANHEYGDTASYAGTVGAALSASLNCANVTLTYADGTLTATTIADNGDGYIVLPVSADAASNRYLTIEYRATGTAPANNIYLTNSTGGTAFVAHGGNNCSLHCIHNNYFAPEFICDGQWHINSYDLLEVAPYLRYEDSKITGIRIPTMSLANNTLEIKSVSIAASSWDDTVTINTGDYALSEQGDYMFTAVAEEGDAVNVVSAQQSDYTFAMEPIGAFIYFRDSNGDAWAKDDYSSIANTYRLSVASFKHRTDSVYGLNVTDYIDGNTFDLTSLGFKMPAANVIVVFVTDYVHYDVNVRTYELGASAVSTSSVSNTAGTTSMSFTEGNVTIEASHNDGVVGRYGSTVKLTAAANTGYRFIGWFEDDDNDLVAGVPYGKMISSNATFTFTEDLHVDSKIIAVFASNTGSDCTFNFMNQSGQILQTMIVANNSYLDLSDVTAVPFKTGYSFSYWSLAALKKDETPKTVTYNGGTYYVLDRMDTNGYSVLFSDKTCTNPCYIQTGSRALSVNVHGVYVRLTTATVTVKVSENGTFTGTNITSRSVPYNATVSVTAADVSGSTFSGWVDYTRGSTRAVASGYCEIGGKYYPYVSYDKVFTFKATDNFTLKPVYNQTDAGVPNVSIASKIQRVDAGSYYTYYAQGLFTINPSDEYEILEWGLLYCYGDAPTTTSYDNDTDTLVTTNVLTMDTPNVLSVCNTISEDDASDTNGDSNPAGQYAAPMYFKVAKTVYCRTYVRYSFVNETTGETEYVVTYGDTYKFDTSEYPSSGASSAYIDATLYTSTDLDPEDYDGGLF